MALLLDGSRLGIALDHRETAQHSAIFAGHLLPRRLAEMAAERNGAVLLTGRQQNTPAIFRHPYIVEFRPALRVHRHRGAQIDQRLLETFRPHVLPPVEVARVPAFKRPQNPTILGEADIVRNLGRVVDVDEVHGMLLFSGLIYWIPPVGWAKAQRRTTQFAQPLMCLCPPYVHTRLVSNSGLRPLP